MSSVSPVEDDAFDLSKKKKKKVSKKSLKTDNAGEGAADIDDLDMADLGGDLEFGTKKKSKKKKDLADGGTEGAGNGGDGLAATGQPWDGRDYKYDELLGRVFRILNEHNPELGGQATKTILKPPQVLREGTKKTVFANFSDLCKLYVFIFPSPTPYVEAGCLRGPPPAPAVHARVIHTPLTPP